MVPFLGISSQPKVLEVVRPVGSNPQMHLWRIVKGQPSWLDAVWVSGGFIFGMPIFNWCNKILTYLEPKGTLYAVLGYLIFLVIFLGFLGVYGAVLHYNGKKLALDFRVPRWTWLVFSMVTFLVWTDLIYHYADTLLPMDYNVHPYPMDVAASSQAVSTRVNNLMYGSMAVVIVFLTLGYALVMSFVKFSPYRANQLATYILYALAVIALAAKLALALRY
jgi:hypothetical protein